ncbi:MAG: DUF1223 domain-containing protein [Flavobacteriaceae bacterium]
MYKRILICAIVVIGMAAMAFNTHLHKDQESSHTAFLKEAETFAPIVVLELFTSQGCSSCPPADALLNTVKKKYPEDVFVLSYHVDYWNYIGWEDPFSNALFTKKQREYNLKFHSKSNYTPQLVVNGKTHFVGSNAEKIYNAVYMGKKQRSANKVTITNSSGNDDRLLFDYTVLGSIEGKNLRAVLVLDKRTTEVRRGENRNRILVNSNIVVAEKSISLNDERGSDFIFIPEIVGDQEKIRLVLVVEDDDYNITAAAKKVIIR